MSKAIVAVGSVSSGGGTSEVTVTLDNKYPAIHRGIQSPILSIIAIQTGATLAANGVESCEITGQVDPGSTPDSTGEYRITGDREIKFYQTAAEDQDVLVCYIPKGTGNTH